MANKEEEAKKLEGSIRYHKDQIRDLKKRLAALRVSADPAATHDQELRKYMAEADDITLTMDDWVDRNVSLDYKSLLSILFLGGCSGEWGARTRWRGTLPGFGGFLLLADRQHILVDPGAGTLDGMYSHDPKIHPALLDRIIVTHAHWDCVRDLRLIVMAACRTGMEKRETRNARLHLHAHSSVLHGVPIDDHDKVFAQARNNGDFRGLDEGTIARLKSQFNDLRSLVPAALEAYDLLFRLQGRYEELSLDNQYRLTDNLHLYTRKSYHALSYGPLHIPALDFIVTRANVPVARCVYLTDTEYRSDIANQYHEHPAPEGAGNGTHIDLLICNVKTLNVLPYPEESAHRGHTMKHLGWYGLLKLIADFKELKLIDRRSLIVLRAWGIETVTTRDRHDNALVATPEKLEVYADAFRQITGLTPVIPDTTWIHLRASDGHVSPTCDVVHIRQPYRRSGAVKSFGGIHYCSTSMERVVQQATAAIDSPEIPVLITGEPGVGKDVLGRAIHQVALDKGKRKAGAFVQFFAPTIVETLAQDQLFGHKKGAFNNATADQRGLLEDAEHGTLLIQELGDAPPQIQSLLLGPLRERKFNRLGDNKELDLSAQVILTTHRPLSHGFEEGAVRYDLYSRCADRHIHIPALRERPEDIPAIIEGWRETMVTFGENKSTLPQLEHAVFALLQRYQWPGNVAQLRTVVGHISESGDWSVDNVQRLVEESHRRDPHETMWPSAIEGNARLPDESDLSELESNILRKLTGGAHSPKDLAAGLGSPVGDIKRALRRLFERRLVRRSGKARNTKYRSAEVRRI